MKNNNRDKTMKKAQLLSVIALLSIGMLSCQKKEQEEKGFTSSQPYCICEYVVTPSFKALMTLQKFLYPYPEKSTDESLMVLVKVDLREGTSSRIVNHTQKGEKEEFLIYAHRYQDLSYNRPYPAPNSTAALAEPISKIRCYELSSTQEAVDVSDKVTFRALTYLPYIKSGYNDEIVPQYKEPVGGHVIGRTEYLVNKPLSEVTIEETTLLDCNSWSYVFELVPIAPYEFKKDSELRITIEIGGRKQEISAPYGNSY